MLNNQTNKNLAFPIAIVVAGVIISGGIFFFRNYNFNRPIVDEKTKQEINVKPITKEDKILGNPNASIIIVEYSDFECPYCQTFHGTMEQVMNEFGRDGKVAWVYRHFPLESIHKNAKPAAIASECVNKIGGNAKFWEYSKALFDSAPDSLIKENLEKAATDLGIDQAQYNSCLTDPAILAKVDADITDGKTIYENDPNFGTPYSFFITKNGTQTKIIGAQPYSVIKELIENFI